MSDSSNSSPVVLQVSSVVSCPVATVWQLWTEPIPILKWNAASDTWFTSYAENDVREGGKFVSRMEAKDGSSGFDFGGTYTQVVPQSKLEYVLGDGRKVKVVFHEEGRNVTRIHEEFEADTAISGNCTVEMQQSGWQSILDNFKRYAEQFHNKKFELLKFNISIAAPVDHVYKLMLNEKSYNEWTKPFNSSSKFEGSWSKGSMIRFIGCDENGKRGGMVSRIWENLPSKFVSIEHLGVIEGENEILSGDKVDGWKGLLETYKFVAVNDRQTTLEVCMESNADFKKYFADTWPKALNVLKQICENNN
jgi:uncharacterized protein YndB with AHSA1/START domain